MSDLNTPNASVPAPSSGKGFSRKIFGLAMLLAIVTAFAFQGSRGLYESTEGRYAECARETVATGNLLEPVLHDENHWTKPPLTYMAIGAGLVCLGNNPWGARAYLAVAFILTVVAVYFAGKAMWDKETGAISALLYATCPYTVAGAFAISCDTLLTLFQAASVAFFWLAISRSRKIYIFLMWLALGLSVLTKGPAAIICFVGIFPAYWLLRKRGNGAPRLFTLSGLAMFVLVGGGWYLYEIYMHPFLLKYWLMDETVGRFAENEFQRNPEPHKIITMYLPIVLFGTGPWAFMVYFSRKHLGVEKGILRRWREWSEQPQWVFVLAGFFIPLVLLCLATSRMPLYLLPLFIPFSLGLGRAFSILLRRGRFRLQTIVIVAVCCALLFVSGKAASAKGHSRGNMAILSAIVQPLLEEYPGSELIIACREELNGLDFYLERTPKRYKFPIKPTDSPEAIGANVVLPPGTLILGRAKHLKYAEDFLPENLYSIAHKDRDWTILLTREPIDLGETLKNAGMALQTGQ